MNSQTKNTLYLLTQLSSIREFGGDLLIINDGFVGINLRFDRPIPVEALSSIKELVDSETERDE